LIVTLKDVNGPIYVDLTYEVSPAADIIRKTATLRYQMNAPLNVESFQSGVWHMPHGEGYRLSYLTGRWAAEIQLTREPVHTGSKVLEVARTTPATTPISDSLLMRVVPQRKTRGEFGSALLAGAAIGGSQWSRRV